MSQLSTYAPTIKPGSGPVFFIEGNNPVEVPPNGAGVIFVVGSGSIDVNGNAGDNTLTITSSIVQGIVTIDGDTGSITGQTVTIYADNAALNCGSSVLFANSGTTSTLNVTDTNKNTIIGLGAGIAGITGTENVCYGWESAKNLTSGSNNIAIGENSGISLTTESFNIYLGHGGVVADSGMIRIGSGGVQTGCYIAGIDGVNVGSVATVVTEDNNILGTAVITAGANITVTPGANTITIAANSSSQVVNYVTVLHAASPYTVLSTDYYISADVTGGIIIVKLPDAPATGRIFVVKDKVGLAATSNITVTTVSGGDTIDGVTTFIMNTNYESANFIFNGSNYEVF